MPVTRIEGWTHADNLALNTNYLKGCRCSKCVSYQNDRNKARREAWKRYGGKHSDEYGSVAANLAAGCQCKRCLALKDHYLLNGIRRRSEAA